MEEQEERYRRLIDNLSPNEQQKDTLNERLATYLEHNLLDLSNLSLTRLPENIFAEFSDLLHLNISNNEFIELPPDVFSNLFELLSLDMSYCLIPQENMEEQISLPEELFYSQVKLMLLDASGNQIEFLPDGIFDKLYNLEALNLAWNLLALLPISIGNCINLEELYLESNFFPVEFKEVYSNYLDVQDFIAPFSQAWSVMNNPIDGLNEINFSDEIQDEKVDLSDSLKNMFKEDDF